MRSHDASCQLLHAYLDNELSIVESIAFEGHLAKCAACAKECDELNRYKKSFHSGEMRLQAPHELLAKVSSLLEKSHSSAESANVLPLDHYRKRSRNRVLLGMAASLFLCVASVLSYQVHDQREKLVLGIVASHANSLLADHLVDVVSSDQHVVKPWFQGKVDFSPKVKDFAEQGFPLIGGRLDYVADRQVVALVYQRRKHIINLYSWPSSGTIKKVVPNQERGYNLMHWTDGQLEFWLVSDLNAEEMATLANFIRS